MVNQGEVEKQLIGIWVQNQMLQYTELFQVDDFFYFRGTFANILQAIKEGKPINLATVAGEAKVADLAELMMRSFPPQIEYFVEQMQLCVAERKYKEYLKTPLEGTAYEKASQMIEKMKTVVPQAKSKDISRQLLDLMDELDKRKSVEKGMGYGIPKLDKKTNGIHKDNLIIVSGRPGVGKSAFALQVANNVLSHGYKVLFISLEMGETELLERLIMHLSDIDGGNMKTGELTKYEWNQTSIAVDKISTYKLDINTKVRNTAQLRVEIARTQPDLVIVDQLGLLREEERYMSRREEITAITRKLKLMAMDFNLPVIALAQINRDANENYPTLANLKESGSIEEDANVVIMLHAPTRQQCEKDGDPYHEVDSGKKTVLIMLAKHRAGEVGNISSVYIGRKYKFMEVAR